MSVAKKKKNRGKLGHINEIVVYVDRCVRRMTHGTDSITLMCICVVSRRMSLEECSMLAPCMREVLVCFRRIEEQDRTRQLGRHVLSCLLTHYHVRGRVQSTWVGVLVGEVSRYSVFPPLWYV